MAAPGVGTNPKSYGKTVAGGTQVGVVKSFSDSEMSSLWYSKSRRYCRAGLLLESLLYRRLYKIQIRPVEGQLSYLVKSEK